MAPEEKSPIARPKFALSQILSQGAARFAEQR
jgi:hypothetical protein